MLSSFAACGTAQAFEPASFADWKVALPVRELSGLRRYFRRLESLRCFRRLESYFTWTLICRGRASSTFGRRISRMPFLKLASALSVLTFAGRAIVREKLP